MSYIGLNPNVPLLNTSTETFSGNGVNQQFALGRNVASASDLDVMIGNTLQRPNTDYEAEGNVLLFTAAPGAGTNNITVVLTQITKLKVMFCCLQRLLEQEPITSQ